MKLIEAILNGFFSGLGSGVVIIVGFCTGYGLSCLIDYLVDKITKLRK